MEISGSNLCNIEIIVDAAMILELTLLGQDEKMFRAL